ncbi:ELWxxDGT repeat protein [Myxococcus sp. 1LA]
MKPHLPLLILLGAAGCGTEADDVTEVEDVAVRSQASDLSQKWELCGKKAVRLADIYPGAAGSDPADLIHGDRILFFTADDGTHGRELWRSSGTGGSGTALVKDIYPGLASSEISNFTRVGNRVFFAADDGVHGYELWVTDGTSAGTYLVKDIYPGPADGIFRPNPFFTSNEPLLIEFGGVLYFGANDGVHGSELWRSDGTEEGTYLVDDIEPGPDGSFPRTFARVGNEAFYFVAAQEVASIDTIHLWRSTGVPGAISVLSRAGDNVIFSPLAVKSRLYFLLDNDEGEARLWKTDGAASNTEQLRPFAGEYPHDLVALGNRLIFSAGDGEPEGDELWTSDGSPSGTQLVKDIWPGPMSSSPSSLAVLGSRVFFAADDGSGDGRELWVSNGTGTGTRLFKDLASGGASSDPNALASIEGTLFFSANDGVHGFEPWVSDGTRSGTKQLHGLAHGSASSSPRDFVRSGWDVFFSADDGKTGRELWALPFRPKGECEQNSNAD